jgi:hypothetical protein
MAGMTPREYFEVLLSEGGCQDLLQDVHTLVLDELRLEEVVRVDNQVKQLS